MTIETTYTQARGQLKSLMDSAMTTAKSSWCDVARVGMWR